MKSIRSYLTAALLSGLVVLLVLGTLVLYLFVRQRIVTQFDGALSGKARALASMIEQEPEGIELEIREQFVPEYGQDEDAEYYEVWEEGGGVIERSASLAGKDLPLRTGPLDEPLLWNLVLPDGRKGRAVGIRFEAYVDEEASEEVESVATLRLVMAVGREEMSRTLMLVLLGSLGALLLVGTGTALIVTRVVRRGMKPLDDLAAGVSEIDAGALDRRFETGGVPRELLPIMERLNGLLARLEQAFARERKLTADMAHELKTPIAELRSMAEVALRWPADRELSREALSNALEISQQMNDKVSVLLQLARCEAGRQVVSPAPVHLKGLLADLWKPWDTLAGERGIRAEFHLDGDGQVVTDRTLLSTIISNLYSNAVEYAPAHGSFTLSVDRQADGYRLRMVNTNDMLTREDLPHIFEQLWRKDPSRSDGTHMGLGLSLVESFAEVLGIHIDVELLASDDFSMVLEIPAVPPCESDQPSVRERKAGTTATGAEDGA